MRKILGTTALAAILLVFGPVPGRTEAQTKGDSVESLRRLEREIRALREGQERMNKQLKEISATLERLRPRPSEANHPPVEPAPPGLTLHLRGAPFKGRRDAKLVLVDFNDFQ